MADGTSYEIDIDVGADGVEPAAAAVARLGEQLTAAGAAAATAAEAVKAGEAAYRLAESSADKAAKAVEKIGLAAEAQRGKLQEALAVGDASGAERAAVTIQKLGLRQAEAAQKAMAAKVALDAEAVALDRLKAASTGATATQAQLAKSLEGAKKAATAAQKAQAAAAGSGDLGKLKDALGQLGGPLGEVGGKAFGAAESLKKLFEAAGSAGPYVALAVAIVAITTALVAATVAITIWSVKLADTARTQRLLTEGIAGSVEAGGELADTIRDLSKRVPQTNEELRNMAADLAKTGLKGQALADALEESAVKAATLKWGPDFKKQTISLDKLSQRFGDNIGAVFGKIDIEPLLEGLSKLVDLFDENSVTGKAMRAVFDSLFQPLVDGAANVIPKVIAGFIQLQIWILKALIFIKPFGSTILEVAQVIGVVLLTALAGIALAFGIVAAAVAACWVIIITLGKAMQWITEAIIGVGKSIADFFGSLDLSTMGSDLIAGLVSGLAGGGGAVVQALTGVVGGAIDAAKSLLGISSPSKVFAEIGANTAEGMAVGVEDTAGSVQGALEAMVAPPTSDGAAPAQTTATATAGVVTYQISIVGGGDAKSNLDAFTDWLESIGAQAGTAVPA